MRKQRAVDITNIPLPRRAQSKLIQSTGRSSKSGSTLLLHQKLLPPGPPRSISGINGGSLRASQFCVSSSSMGVRKLPSRFYLLGKGRYGKRPPSFTSEYAAPSIDSEDSGFGCDFHSSESQLSWSNDEAAKLGANTNSTSAIQQPIFSLTSRTLSNSNLSTSSHISTSSSSSGSSFTIPQFSTSSPAEKQFLTTLLHESLAQEDHAIDQFDGPYYSTANISPTDSSSSPLSSASGSTFSSISPSPSLAPSPESTISPGKVLLIVPGTSVTTTSGVNTTQPLDFAQVFGKLSSTTTTTSTNILNSSIVNELFQTKTALGSIAEEQQGQEHVGEQQLACDSRIIKIDQGIHTKNIELSPEIRAADGDSRSNEAFHTTYSLKNENLETDSNPTPTSVPSSVAFAAGAYSKLQDILIESSREALELQQQQSSDCRNPNGVGEGENIPTTTATSQVDPMVILSQAVNLQKELFEEPALDGIPISVKSTSVNGFGFSKGITTTTTTATAADPQLQSSTTLLTVLPQQTNNQTVLDSSQQPLKLMQLTENIRMSPDNGDRAVTAPSALSFSVHQVGTGQMPTTPSPMDISATSASTPTVAVSSPIPMKRTRFTFPHPVGKGSGLKLRNQNHNQNYMPARSVGKRLPPGTTPTLTSNLASYTRDGRVQLQIVSQPEEQHRARYQTEGSRGAIKDRKGNGFPTVKLVGYDKAATLQIFIGTDQGKVSPHMFYQACKVTGKSSTPCIEKKVEGTILIEIEFEPSKEMVISCDCVGILKERNVDVEQRFPFHHASQSRKKSTKCRMIFRTTVVNSDGVEETLQVASLPILCTQPPGVPEICKQSLSECPAKGGLELFVVGKNFLKDTRVIFQQEDGDGRVIWESSSEPLKDYLQQNHLICVVPPYKEEKMIEAVECKVLVVSGGKLSEPHRFTYLPELGTVHLGVPQSLSNCAPSSQNPQQNQVQAPPQVIQAGLVQQIQGGQGLTSVDIQTVNAMITARENALVKSVIVSSPSDSCSTISINSPEGSLQSQPSPPATVVSPVASTVLNPLSNMGFTTAPLIQTQTTNADNLSVVGNFQSALQQAVQQQQQAQAQPVDTKPVVELMKPEIMESINKSPVTSTFPALTLQPENKPAVSNAIPLDLQFPTADMPTTEAPTVTTVTNPFQSNEQQLNCVSIPQMINLGINNSIPTTATMPPVLTAATVPVSDTPQQQHTTPTSPNNVVITNGSPPATVTVQTLTVADCLGQAIIKAEPTPMNNEQITIAMNNSVVTVAPPTTTAPLQNGATPQVMGLLGGGELQPHQGTIANALSQMSDNELINYINPNCFDGGLL